jgi:protein TonB
MQRDTPRHFTAYVITVLIYVSMAAILWYTQKHYFVSSKVEKESTIKMSLSEFVPEVVAPPEKVLPPEPIVESKPPEETPIIEEVTPEPVVEKVVKKPLPVIKKIKKKVVKKKVVKKKITQKKVKKKVKKKVSRQQASLRQSRSSKAEQNRFWSALRRKIDRNKFYPRIAKKRGMQGSVKVKFTILANGNVGHISVSGPKVFYNSAKNAVKNAFPINAKKSPISLPTSINLTLHYKVR